MKKIILFLLSSMLSVGLCLNASAEGYSWYCKRNKEHKQPLIDSDFSFVEKYNGYYIDKKHGDDCPDKVVYLTFDAGYENGNVERILNALQEQDVKGCFFILPHLIEANKELVLRMVKEGHTVGNHSTHHGDMTKINSEAVFAKELSEIEEKYKELTGQEMAKFFRPPEGRFSEQCLDYANRLGYKTIFWSFAYADWDNQKQMNKDEALDKIISNIHNGAVLLLHPTSKTNADLLPELIQNLKEMGYRFGTIEELTA